MCSGSSALHAVFGFDRNLLRFLSFCDFWCIFAVSNGPQHPPCKCVRNHTGTTKSTVGFRGMLLLEVLKLKFLKMQFPAFWVSCVDLCRQEWHH